MSETTPTTVSPVEEQIQQELVKHNVTEAIIANLKEKYMPLQINGIDDKETYLKVKEARKECKALRVMAKKICVAGREQANRTQQAWVAKEKEVTGEIGEVEDHLEKQEKEFDEAVAAEKNRRKREQEEQFIIRNQILSGMSVLYSDGHYTLGEVSFEMSLVKECDPDIWENDILPMFKEEYQKVEAETIEAERLKREREDEFKRQQEALEQKQRELSEKEAALKAAQDEQERKQREEQENKAAAAKAAEQTRIKERAGQLQKLGLYLEIINDHIFYNGYDCSVSHLDITGYSDEKWNGMIEKMTIHVAKIKEEEQQKRLAEIEAQKEVTHRNELRKARLSVLRQYEYDWAHGDIADPSDESWESLVADIKDDYEKKQKEKWEKEQEEKRKADELKKQQEMEQAKDKEKWNEMIRQVNAIEVYEMRSSQYRTKAMKFRQKLDELKALIDG